LNLPVYIVCFIPGTYSNQLNLQIVTECDDCPGGYYCLQEGLTAPSGECGEGMIVTLTGG